MRQYKIIKSADISYLETEMNELAEEGYVLSQMTVQAVTPNLEIVIVVMERQC